MYIYLVNSMQLCFMVLMQLQVVLDSIMMGKHLALLVHLLQT